MKTAPGTNGHSPQSVSDQAEPVSGDPPSQSTDDQSVPKSLSRP
jgi:hypothetical protein